MRAMDSRRSVRLALCAIGALLLGCSDAPSGKGALGSTGNRAIEPPAQPVIDVAGGRPAGATSELSPPLDESVARSQPVPHYSSYVLTMPEVPGVVPWKKLAQVQVEPGAQAALQFDPDVAKLDAQQVKLQGFMLPLEVGEKHRRFILAALPPSCSFCLPGGPESVVEVVAREPLAFTIEPIVVSGKFSVLKSDPLGLYYRLTEAKPATPG